MLAGPPGSSAAVSANCPRSEEHTSELQSLRHLVCRLLLEKKKKISDFSFHGDAVYAVLRDDHTLLAVVMLATPGLGLHHGIPRVAKIDKRVGPNQVEPTGC